MSALETFVLEGVQWTVYDWLGDAVCYQRRCSLCDGGLLYTPARFCVACDGSGLIVEHEDPRVTFAKETP